MNKNRITAKKSCNTEGGQMPAAASEHTKKWSGQSARNAEGFDPETLLAITKKFGVRDQQLMATIVEDARRIRTAYPFALPSDELQFAMAIMLEYEAKTLLEARLAVQIEGNYQASLFFMEKASLPSLSAEKIDANLARANSLMELQTKQIELLLKLRGQTGRQKVTVEHIHIHESSKPVEGSVGTGANDTGETPWIVTN